MKYSLFTLSLLFLSLISAAQKKQAKPVSNWLYIGTYTQKEAHVDGKATGIYIYELNPGTGALSYLSTSPKTINPSYVTVHPNGQWLYAANETGDGKISSFKIDRTKKQLVFINSVSSHGDAPCYVSIDPSGKFLMTANYSSGTVALFPINQDGSLQEASSVDKHEGKGPNPRQESPHAHMITPGPGAFIYAVDLGTDQVITYKIDVTRSALIRQNIYQAQPGAGPRHLAFHKNNQWAYLINELNGTVEACSIQPSTGALTRFQEISTLPDGETRSAGCADIHVHPSGKFLYASNRGEINTLAVYAIDQTDGRLTIIQQVAVKGRTPRSFVIDPSGKFLLVANQDTGNIITFKIDNNTGKLNDTGIDTKVPTPVCLKF